MRRHNMTLQVLLDGITYEKNNTHINLDEINIAHITIDSRKVVPGTLFICLRGLNVDGHDYIDAAFASGAVAILTEQPCESVGAAIITVQNTRQAMAYVAANFYNNPAKKLRLIGVTGTNGKTTTTYFIEEILRKLGAKTGIIGTVGARVGETPLDIPFATSTTPDPLELHAMFAKMVDAGVEFLVMEVTSHALALYKMEGLAFEIGVFTNLTQDHLDFHGTMEKYKRAKAQLFLQSKFAIVNMDDEASATMLEHHGDDPYLAYGIDSQCVDVSGASSVMKAVNVKYLPDGTNFELDSGMYKLPVGGRFNVYNILATIGVAHTLGYQLDAVKTAVASISGVPGRIQSVPNNLGVQIYVDYAHSPDSLEKIIMSIKEITPGRVVTIFGCGGDRDTAKRPIMGRIASELSHHTIITSDNPRTENPFVIIKQIEEGIDAQNASYEVVENRREAIETGVNMLKSGDSLIIAGKGHEDYQEINITKYPFSDFDTAVATLTKNAI